MASTKGKVGEQQSTAPAAKQAAESYDLNDMETMKRIGEIRRTGKEKGNPYAGADADFLRKVYVYGKPAFTNIVTDPDTNKVISAELTAAAKKYYEEQAAKFAEIAKSITSAIQPETVINMRNAIANITAAANKIINSFMTDEMRDLLKSLPRDFEEIAKAWRELEELQPYIDEELKKPEYNGLTLDDLLNNSEAHDFLEPGSILYKVYHAAKDAKAKHDAEIAAQNAGRAERREIKAAAETTNAIMEIRGGNYSIFSERSLWDAFTPGRIVKMGEPVKKYIDQNGRITKHQFEPGDIEKIDDPAAISAKAVMLLNSIVRNSVDDPRKTPIEQTDFYKNDGKLRFYVKGVIDTIQNDPRSLIKAQDIKNDQQLDINRKTAGAVYLEKLFEPLQGYIGTMENGSRWSVFNYVGYDAKTDIMTVQTPYIYQLMHKTQAAYFDRQENQKTRQLENKKPYRKDMVPLELNEMFKGAAYNEDETILEIAFYITNTLLQAGNTGKAKDMRIKYSTIVNNCPRLKSRLDMIQTAPTETYTGKDGKEHTRNKTAIYNGELRKIARAFDVIQNPDECDATKQYEFLNITPANKNKAGAFVLTPPTKSTLQDQIIITWRRIKDETAEQ